MCNFGLIETAQATSETRPGPPSATPQQADKVPQPLISSELPFCLQASTLWSCWLWLSVCPLGLLDSARWARGSELPPALPYAGGFPPLLLEAHTLAPYRRERWPSWACLQNLPPVCWASIRAGRAGVELQWSCTRPGRGASLWPAGHSGPSWEPHLLPSRAPRRPEIQRGSRTGLWAGGALGSIPSQLSHDAPVIWALLLGTPTPHSCRDQPAAPPPPGPRPSMCPGSGSLSHGGDGSRGPRNLKRKQQWPENLENVSKC